MYVISVLLKGLVFAGIADLARPADKLSPSQSTALAATGKYRCLPIIYGSESYR